MNIVSICLLDKYNSPGLFMFVKNAIAAFNVNPFLPLSSKYFAYSKISIRPLLLSNNS
jgi:hypothetical protein